MACGPGILLGIGGSSDSLRSVHLVKFDGSEGQITTARPFVVRARVVLWGWNMFSQWGLRLGTDF